MKKFALGLLASVTLLAFTPAYADARQEGRLIGDGVKLPREYVPGKSGQERRDEILGWMFDHGGRTGHACNTTEKFCTTFAYVSLDDNGMLQINERAYFDGTPPISFYCRSNGSDDIDACYVFETGSYVVRAKDGATGEWKVMWTSNSQM
jgi:hypothetical protein